MRGVGMQGGRVFIIVERVVSIVLPFSAFLDGEDGCFGAGRSGRMWERWTARHGLHGLT